MNHESRDTMEYTGLGVSWELYIIGFWLGWVGLTSRYVELIRMLFCSSCIDLSTITLYYSFGRQILCHVGYM
jgi:hypothetical protein